MAALFIHFHLLTFHRASARFNSFLLFRGPDPSSSLVLYTRTGARIVVNRPLTILLSEVHQRQFARVPATRPHKWHVSTWTRDIIRELRNIRFPLNNISYWTMMKTASCRMRNLVNLWAFVSPELFFLSVKHCFSLSMLSILLIKLRKLLKNDLQVIIV